VAPVAKHKDPDPKEAAKGPTITRRNSQVDFAKPTQTIIIFDWDDTLFPTTYVRDDLNLQWRKPIEKQDLSKEQKREISGHLEKCERHAAQLLQLAITLGKVVLVTLARAPWVSECCKQFYPKVGKIVDDFRVPIVYAQDGQHVDYDKQKMMSSDEVEFFYAMMKGKAIAKVVGKFYSQYSGQSWKNIISIGDSDFERLGTFQATQQYMTFAKLDTSGDMKLDVHEMKQLWLQDKPHITDTEAQMLFNGVDKDKDGLVDIDEYFDFIFSSTNLYSIINNKKAQGLKGAQESTQSKVLETVSPEGHVFRIRTKTLKIMDEPTVEELEVQLPLMRKWLPQLVFLDSGFDFSLDDMDNRTRIKEIENALKDVAIGASSKPIKTNEVKTPPVEKSQPKSVDSHKDQKGHDDRPGGKTTVGAAARSFGARFLGR
jgi:hypothetical protein